MSDERLQALAEHVRRADDDRVPLLLAGGGTKAFLHEPAAPAQSASGNVGAAAVRTLDLRGYAGIVDYEPTELVVTARCGTPLAALEAALAERGQMLGFEPPHFGAQATVGGCVAAGLSGPRRATAGSLRDFVLGARVIDARGRVLAFGGQVMKNVAGYDVSRLMAGSMGILGAIVEVSLKVLPRPIAETTLRFELSQADAVLRFNQWAGQPLPISATAWSDGAAWVRLSGAPPAIDAALRSLGGEQVAAAQADAWWAGLRNQSAAFFEPASQGRASLWRLSVPAIAAPLALPPALAGQGAASLVEWGGALRWLSVDAGLPAEADAALRIRAAAEAAGGTASLFRRAPAHGAWAPLRTHPLAPAVAGIHQRLKREFDPNGIFNPHHLVPGL